MPYDNVWVDGLAVAAVLGLYGLYAWWQHRRREVRPSPSGPPSHVRLAGVRRRCVGCRQVKLTMDVAEGWSAPPLPYCAGCLRDTVGVEHGGEAA